MTRSEYIKQRLAELNEIFSTLNSPGWKRFETEILDKLEADAFRGYVQTAADDTVAIVGWQQRWKIAEEIHRWASVESVREAIIANREALREIEEGQAEDGGIDSDLAKRPSRLGEFVRKVRDLLNGQDLVKA